MLVLMSKRLQTTPMSSFVLFSLWCGTIHTMTTNATITCPSSWRTIWMRLSDVMQSKHLAGMPRPTLCALAILVSWAFFLLAVDVFCSPHCLHEGFLPHCDREATNMAKHGALYPIVHLALTLQLGVVQYSPAFIFGCCRLLVHVKCWIASLNILFTPFVEALQHLEFPPKAFTNDSPFQNTCMLRMKMLCWCFDFFIMRGSLLPGLPLLTLYCSPDWDRHFAEPENFLEDPLVPSAPFRRT